jgi:hypothetical protein
MKTKADGTGRISRTEIAMDKAASFVIPKLTATELAAMTATQIAETPVIFNTTDSKVYAYNGTAMAALAFAA